MRTEEETRQLAFRLPQSLIGRLEHCEKKIQTTGVNLSRTELVRLLLSYALDATSCDLATLIKWDGDDMRRVTRDAKGENHDGARRNHNNHKARRR